MANSPQISSLRSFNYDLPRELTGFKKPVRYCRVAVSEDELTKDPETLTGVICGAVNFSEGDRVAFATVGGSATTLVTRRETGLPD